MFSDNPDIINAVEWVLFSKEYENDSMNEVAKELTKPQTDSSFLSIVRQDRIHVIER